MREKKWKFNKTLVMTALTIALSGCSDDSLEDGSSPSVPVVPDLPVGTDLVVFNDSVNVNWPAWDCCGGTTPTNPVETDSYGLVTEFSVNAQPAVLGFTRSVEAGPLDVSAMSTNGTLAFDFKMMNSPGQANWHVKLESNGGAQNGSTGEEVELAIAQPVLNTWQHVSFDLVDLANQGLDLSSIDNVLIYPEWGSGEGAVYRVDNIKFMESDTPVVPTVPTPDLGDKLSLDLAMTDFGGTTTELNAANPSALAVSQQSLSQSLLSTKDTVVKTTKIAGAETWAGTTLGDSTVLSITEARSKVSLWVYSPKAGVPVLFKVEDSTNDAHFVEALTQTKAVQQWEKITFDFTKHTNGTPDLNPNYTYDKKSVFFDFGTSPSEDQEFYWDDVTFVELSGITPPVDPVDPPVDPVDPPVEPGSPISGDGATTTIAEGINFEDKTLTWEVFENADNPALVFVDNPDTNGLNVSNTVAKITARADGAPWAGSVTKSVDSFSLDTTNYLIKVMVYKDKISPVALKLATVSQWGAEIHVTNTKVGEWEELTFDFSKHPEFDYVPEAISEVVIFPDFNERDADTVMYFDNVVFSGK